MSSYLSDSEFDDEENSEQELSPLLQAIAPKLMPCRIREYQADDLDACAEIYRSNEPELDPAGLAAFVEFLDVGTSYYLVLEYNDDIVACGGLELVGDSDTASLVHCMVHGEYQRRGFGTTLLAAHIALLEPEERPVELWLKASRTSAAFAGRFGFSLHSVSAKAAGPGQDHANAWLSVDEQDVEDVRQALEERSIRIFLNDPGEEDDEEES